MKICKISILAVVTLTAVLFGVAAYSFFGGQELSKNMGSYRSFSFYADQPGNAAVNWMQPGNAPVDPWDEFWFDSSGNFNVAAGVKIPGTVTTGVNSLNPLTGYDVTAFGADPTGASDSTTAFANWYAKLSTGNNLVGIIPAGTYSVSSFPTISAPIQIFCLGPVTLRHTGYGVFISVLSGSASELGPFIQGPLTVLAGPNTTVLLKWAGTFHGEMNGVDLDGNKIANVIGFWLTNSTTGGSYYNLFQHLLVRNCGIDYLFQDTAGATGSIGDNTFVNCKAQSAQWSGSTWAASTNYSTAAIVVPTSSNWNGTIFKCTTPGTSGSTEPNWSAATLIGDKINDGTLTWTRVSWDDQTSVPSPGIGWLFSNGSQGETVIGGDAESNQGYGMAWIGWDGSTFSNASYTDVYGLWNENNGNKLTPTAPYHALLLDSTTNTQSTATAIDFDVHLLADNGYFDGLSLIGAGSNVPGNAVGQRVMVGEFGDSTGNFRTNFLQANTAFLAPDGTASYPGVAFFSEQRTGFARTANGQITADLNKSGNTFSPFMFNTDGFYLYEPFYSESTTFANLPACSTATKFAEANITDGPASPSWHQAVTAGGGSTPMKLYCNGTDWTVEAY